MIVFEARSRIDERYIQVQQLGGNGRPVWYTAHYGTVEGERHGMDGAMFRTMIGDIRDIIESWLRDEAYMSPEYSILVDNWPEDLRLTAGATVLER